MWLILVELQGGLPDSAATQGFAQSLLDKLPRSSNQNGANSYAQQERKKAALASRNRAYSILEASDEEEAPPVVEMAPTTKALPAKAKQLRKSKVCSSALTDDNDRPWDKLTRFEDTWNRKKCVCLGVVYLSV